MSAEIPPLKSLADSPVFLSSILESMPQMVFLKDAKELNFVFFNKAGEKLTGLSRTQLLGKNDFDFFPKEQAEFFTSKDKEVLEKGHGVDIPEEPLDTPYGKRILHTKKIPILDEKSRPQFLLGISEDITEIVALRKRIQHAQKLESVGFMAAGLGHEFNNILTAILFSIGKIKENLSNPGLIESCSAEIIHSVQRTAFLTKQLLTFSNQDISSPEDLDLNEQIENLSERISATVEDQAKAVFTLAPAESLINIDSKSLVQLVLNLVQNSLDAMIGKNDELNISTSSIGIKQEDFHDYPEAEVGDYVVLTVQDTGIGMSDEAKAHLFQPFFTTKSRSSHLGLGLSTVYRIARKAGGFVSVESQAGQGTRVRVFFPAIKKLLGKSLSSAAGAAGLPPQPDPTAKKNILLVEDESVVRTLAVRILRRDYNVVEAVNGVDALEQAQKMGDGLDLLVTDIVMPKMTGSELAKQLLASRPDLKILFMSGFADQSELSDLVKSRPFLPKPFSPHDLLTRVNAILNAENKINPLS